MSIPRRATVTLRNIRGLHARASAKFCAVASSFEANIRVEFDGWSVPGDSIMGLMTMCAEVGDEIAITADGAQAEEALDTLVKLVEDRFGEDK